MAKLTIPKVPTYKTTTPSGKEVEYRPYTVREESFLLQAKEVNDEKEMLHTILNLIKECTIGTDVSKLSIIDIEWIFLQIRIKSVGDIIEQSFRCLNEINGNKCNTVFETNIDLNKVSFEGELSKTIDIVFPTGTYKISFGQPPLKLHAKTEIEQIYSMVTSILDPVNGLLTKDDIDLESFTDFVSTFTNAQYEQLTDGMHSLATLYFEHDIRCPVCKKQTKKVYRSLLDFFG